MTSKISRIVLTSLGVGIGFLLLGQIVGLILKG